jgi:hypothetical protein
MRSLLIITALCAAGCGPKCPQPFYDGEATDEVWAVLADAKGRANLDDAKAAQIKTPMRGATVSVAGAKPAFGWTSSLSAQRENAPVGFGARSAHAGVGAGLASWLTQTVWGHQAPITGTVHWLRFNADKSCPLAEVVTTLNSWTPNDTAWAQFKTASGQSPTIEAISAYVTDNRITEGPFKPTIAVSFTLAP